MSAPIQGFLLVVERDGGPVFYGKWRDSERHQVKRRLGLAWVEPDGRGGWRKRRGRCPEGCLEERAAHATLREAIDAEEKRIVLRAKEAPVSLDDDRTFAAAANSWLADGLSVREWKWSTYMDYRDTARRIAGRSASAMSGRFGSTSSSGSSPGSSPGATARPWIARPHRGCGRNTRWYFALFSTTRSSWGG